MTESSTPPVAALGKKAKATPIPKSPAAPSSPRVAKLPKAPIPQKTVPATKVTKEVKSEKVKKPKLVRDSFTIPKAEYELLDALKARAVRLKQPAKKSELIRSGIKLLVGLTDAAFLAAMQATPSLKTGRPKAEPDSKA